MALGYAAEVTSELLPREHETDFTLSYPFRSLSSVYFDAAIRQIHNAYMEISTRSAQSLMLAAIFYAYLQRPLQAWSMLGAAATKCRVLLSYGTANTEDSECVSEVSWLACSKTSSAFLRPSRLSMIGHIIPLQVY
jgi:hypothetical protein